MKQVGRSLTREDQIEECTPAGILITHQPGRGVDPTFSLGFSRAVDVVAGGSLRLISAVGCWTSGFAVEKRAKRSRKYRAIVGLLDDVYVNYQLPFRFFNSREVYTAVARIFADRSRGKAAPHSEHPAEKDKDKLVALCPNPHRVNGTFSLLGHAQLSCSRAKNKNSLLSSLLSCRSSNVYQARGREPQGVEPVRPRHGRQCQEASGAWSGVGRCNPRGACCRRRHRDHRQARKKCPDSVIL